MGAAAAMLSVLVADDEDGIRDLLCHWLETHGHKVVAVDSARQAMLTAEREAFDLVITDIVMPDGDGYELIGHLRKARPEARIVAISGGGRYLQGNDCLRIARGLGAHAAVKKPFNWDQLQAGIDQALTIPFANKSANELR